MIVIGNIFQVFWVNFCHKINNVIHQSNGVDSPKQNELTEIKT